jgi:hypothetical protein
MLPKKINILGHTITIKRVKRIPIKGSGNCRGLWVPDKNLIYVVVGNTDLEEQTLWHEIVHAMLDNIGYQELSDDEQFVDRLGSILHQVYKSIEKE